MQILESLSLELKNSLENIVNKIELADNFQITHKDYASVEITPEIIAQLQKLPLNFQKKYLAGKLKKYLADIYFHGCLSKSCFEVNENILPLENNSIKGINREFYEQLKANNYGRGYFDPGWVIIKEEDDGSLAVKKNELTFHIQRDHRHLRQSDLQATVNDTVAIKLPHNRWQNEFYVAVSNNGLVKVNTQKQIIEIYFNINSEGAIILLRELTQILNERKIIFTLKLLDEPSNYPCYDAVILTIYQDDYLSIFEVIKNIYPSLQKHLNQETPISTFKLADGIGLAKVTEESFANNFLNAISNGLLKAWYKKDSSPNNRFQYIEEELSLAKINLQYPYLHSYCDRIYQPLI